MAQGGGRGRAKRSVTRATRCLTYLHYKMSAEEKQNNLKLSRKFLTQFLELYKESPCLWDRQDPDYKKKKIRNEAIGRLTQLVNNYDPKATRVHVLRKIESLRSCVRREHHKVQFSIRNNLLYEPNLWYYHLLSFVFDDRDGKKSESETVSHVTIRALLAPELAALRSR